MFERSKHIIVSVMSFVTILALTIGISCKHDPIYPSVCFESQILPIFQSRCASTGCHDAVTSREGLVLTSYQGIIDGGIVPGNASRSRLYRSMTGGEELMPPTGKLDDASLQLIRSWIESGAENTTNCDLSNSDCDTTNVTYSGTVQPIFNTHCNGCHNSGAVHNFDGYTPLSTYLATSSQILIDNINYTGAQPMPPTGELNECLRRQISIWIAAGYPNN